MTTALWLFLWLLAPQNMTSSIGGVVVRAGTTQPLTNETVALWPTTRTVKTNAAGRFDFPNVAPGDYVLTVVRDRIKTRVPVIITAARRGEYLTVEVKSPPAIAGTVFDPNGERVAGAPVHAHRTVYSPTGPRLKSVLSVLSDDLGEFRLFWLRPGEYFVSASLNDRDQRLAARGINLTPNLSRPDDGWPTIYYGGGYSPSLAQRVRLSAETDSTGTQIFLKDGPRYTINVVLVPDGTCARVVVAPEGGFVTSSDFGERVCGGVRVTGLSQGTYAILATNDVLASDVVRATTLNLTTEVKVPMQRTADVVGRVVSGDGPFLARGFPNPAGPRGGVGGARGFPGPPGPLAGVNVRLSRSAQDITQEIEAPIGSDGWFTIPGVGPGSYDVSIQPLPDTSYVKAIQYGPSDVLFAPIVINSSVPLGELTIQMSWSSAAAEGVIVDRVGKPVPGGEVVLVPLGNRRRPDRYLATIADAGGHFKIEGIPPIDYAVLAFEDIQPQEYFVFSYDSAAFNRYMPNAQILSSGASNTMFRLIAIPADETVRGLR